MDEHSQVEKRADSGCGGFCGNLHHYHPWSDGQTTGCGLHTLHLLGACQGGLKQYLNLPVDFFRCSRASFGQRTPAQGNGARYTKQA